MRQREIVVQSPKPKLQKRTPEFRYLYCNAFGLQMNGNEIVLSCGISEDVGDPENSILEQTGVVLSLPSAKLLMNLLQTVLGRFEAENKTVIPFDATKLDAIASSSSAVPIGKR